MAPNHGLKYPKCVVTQKGWYLLVSEAFGCITTAIFSENDNLSKTRYEENFYTIVSTDNWVQFSELFAIFQRPWYTQGLWKIAKKPNPIVKFGCGNDCLNAYFFQNFQFHFSKNHQNYKKNIWVTKKLKNYSLVHIFWFMFCGANDFFGFYIF